MTDDAWAAYLEAARELDVARRDATVAAGLDRPVRAAHDDLAVVRARLVTQRTRLRELGAEESALIPTLDEVTAVSVGMGEGPAAIRSALQRARDTVEAAETKLPPHRPAPPRTPVWIRNLVVYGALAVAVLVVQLALYTTASPEALPAFALLFGVALPALAFALGWVAIGLAFPRGDNGRADRTPALGLLVCAAPSLVTCAGVGVLALLG
ncbi:hypothetical protein [Catenuloplanes atrovinosus]|uniref:Uncharacterized protein n=1 Tax=Catenuloplanes atrovinosus TaxID=137266 RepID=A0AAE4CD56_9ACTN|nr:hypothetical protein [Catenuloplanes atrovinosus]MDR7280286.1 hypothetical protein [Catenuloplanes atrovinosus]